MKASHKTISATGAEYTFSSTSAFPEAVARQNVCGLHKMVVIDEHDAQEIEAATVQEDVVSTSAGIAEDSLPNFVRLEAEERLDEFPGRHAK